MQKSMDFVVLRGDRRQNILCDLLIADGHRAQLLPEPEKWGQENLFPPGAFLLTAKASEKLKLAADNAGFHVIEYGKLPQFLEENGKITAEGAAELAMRRRLRTLRGCDALVIGAGHIGAPMLRLLRGFGARQVTAAVRRPEQCIRLAASGQEAFQSDQLAERISEYDLVINTAPAHVLTEEVLLQARPDVLILDLATAPGGVDWEAARRLRLKAFPAPALPGRLFPVSGAVVIRDAVYALLQGGLYE